MRRSWDPWILINNTVVLIHFEWQNWKSNLGQTLTFYYVPTQAVKDKLVITSSGIATAYILGQ